MKSKFGFLSALVAAALVVGVSSPAKAITMSVVGVNNSTQSLSGGAAGDRAASNSLIVGDSGGSAFDVKNATINAASRYISNAAADRAVAFSGGTANATINSDYTLTVSVTALASMSWTIDIDTRLTGSLVQLDDNLGVGNGGSATVSAVTGRYNGNVVGGLGLASASSRGSSSNTSGEQTAVNFSSPIYTVSGTGSASFPLRFTWSSTATSPAAVNGGDETAARFGAPSVLGGATADDYPGVGGRDINNDGHFVNMVLTVTVPEPSTIAMGSIGAIGLAFSAWRRRRSK